jgi:hypothetical protein
MMGIGPLELLLLLSLVGVYFLPIIVATLRGIRGPALRNVVLIDVLVGWTGIGWIAAIILAVRRIEDTTAHRSERGTPSL